MTNKCPFAHTAPPKTTNRDWWPNQLDISVLHQHPDSASPLTNEFNYREAFAELDLDAIKADLVELMTDSQPWWPADYGHYGPLFIRMAWHSAGTYRTADGRGGAGTGNQRFAPLNSWPDNGNLDKARRLLWPIKQKYGNSISWGDLMILAGNCALESMGFETLGFSGGREDLWAPEEDIHWGNETEWLAGERHDDDNQLDQPLAAVQMGLIYVNPEGPNGNPDPAASAVDVRETFARMGMNDEETVALVAGGHTFGKAHGAGDADLVGVEPEGAPIEAQGFGWISEHGSGRAGDTITSGIEGAWTPTPTQWDNSYFETLFKYEWQLTKSPAGAQQWVPVDADADVPDAHDADKKHVPIMTTADLALRNDDAYEAISRRFLANPDEFAKAFAHAWFKLTHRDMGPASRYLGKEVPEETFVWQDPVPARGASIITAEHVNQLKAMIEGADIGISALVKTAWASASTYRGSDFRGGANGARIQLEPQRSWAVNEPEALDTVLTALKAIQSEFNQGAANEVSLADLIVLGGVVAIEQAAQRGGYTIEVPFTPGRTDASQAETDVDSVNVLEPEVDGFRNYQPRLYSTSPEAQLVDRAQLLGLSAPQMTALVGGLRVLGANHGDSKRGVFTDREGTLSNDFFTQLLDMATEWKPADEPGVYEGFDRDTGEQKWTGSRVDLLFGSNSQLRAIAEIYASNDGEQRFVDEFIAAWTKVMEADRFDLS